MQLAGHLRGKALQEWNLLAKEQKTTFQSAATALRKRIDPQNRVIAATDFRHAVQAEGEPVADYIRRIERLFQLAYGRDNLSSETRETMLHSQLHGGLRYDVVKGPAVSGAQSYQELCLAARQEEKRAAELKLRQQYTRSAPPAHVNKKKQTENKQAEKTVGNTEPPVKKTSQISSSRRCYICDSPDHLAKQCKSRKQESKPQPQSGQNKPPGTKSVRCQECGVTAPSADGDNPCEYLYSSDDGEVALVRLEDRGSKPCLAPVQVQGVPAEGVIDTGADISIIGADLFKWVAAAAHLKKRDFKDPDKVPHSYDQRPFKLHGKIMLDITFLDKTLRTPVYVKMDAPDPLLLSEGVCRQLGIVSYHPSLSTDPAREVSTVAQMQSVRVRLVQAVRVPPLRSAIVQLAVEGGEGLDGPVLLEPTPQFTGAGCTGLCSSETLVEGVSGLTQVVLTNPTGFTQHLDGGVLVGSATGAALVEPRIEPVKGEQRTLVRVVSSEQADSRKRALATFLEEEATSLSWQQRDLLSRLLFEHHEAFALSDGDRGETGMVKLEIDTGDACPKRQAPRRAPFALRQEIARQLSKMQGLGVIRPSSSDWASPNVLVKKKDGSLKFCVDYRELNSITKSDLFPLPRIDDLLDQLGQSKFFSTLDLASGYWQVQVHSNSIEKTAFITHQGLYEFQVMPFGLKNAPAVFQRLMQQVLRGLNPEEGPPFVSVYIDDILIFSRTFEDHMSHLRSVIERLHSAGLKLKPSKCHFICQTVEYLGHLITPGGVRPNPERVSAVKEFPKPTSIHEVRQFLGLTSYYRRFVRNFARVAQPLHALTRKGALFDWSPECEAAFCSLKRLLISAPILCYPNFDKDFRLETDASVKGLGAVLSQQQTDQKYHPVAYVGPSLHRNGTTL